MAGRAGRLGFNEIGKAIILAETPFERAQLFQKYVLGTPEEVKSSFQNRDLPTWTLRLLSQVRGVRASDIPALLVNTFGGYTASRGAPQWIAAVKADVTNLISRLLLAGLAEQENDIIHLTLLGRACGASSLSFESGLRLVELMRQLDASQTQPSLTLAMIQVLDEMDAIYTPVMKRGRSESVRASEVAQRYGQATMQSLQRYCRDESEFWCRCKRASLLHDWIEGTPVDILEKRYSTTPFQGAVGYGDIMRIVEGTRFHLRSAHQISDGAVSRPAGIPDEFGRHFAASRIWPAIQRLGSHRAADALDERTVLGACKRWVLWARQCGRAQLRAST